MNKTDLEKTLVKRLKALGLILCLFSLISLATVILPEPPEEEFSDAGLFVDLEEIPPLNPFLVAGVFAVVGGGCLFVASRKKRSP